MVLHALKNGIPVVTASGNTDDNAGGYSPARVKAALTVGAIDSTYSHWTRSCAGSSVDLLAPGVDITSTWVNSNAGTTTLSGSSMAAPQVAGLVAYHLSLYPKLRVRSINRRIKQKGTPNLVKGMPINTSNKVLFNCWNENCYPVAAPQNTTMMSNSTVPVNTTAPATTTTATLTVVSSTTLAGTTITPAPSEPISPAEYQPGC